MTYLDQQLPRISAGTGWTNLTILGEIGCFYTARGYVPALSVQRGEVEHVLLVGAQSLARPLEELRIATDGTLAGKDIRIRKVRAEISAPYELEVITRD